MHGLFLGVKCGHFFPHTRLVPKFVLKGGGWGGRFRRKIKFQTCKPVGPVRTGNLKIFRNKDGNKPGISV